MQLDLLKNKLETRGRKRKIPQNTMGGSFHKNYNPNCKRPLNSKKALHIILKSSQAKFSKSFNHSSNQQKVWDIIDRAAKKFGVRLYDYANGGNHLHILVRVKRREDYTKFIRTVTGLISRHINKVERGKKLKTKFWDSRPFTRIVHFGNDFKKVKHYFMRNTLEALGWMSYQKRKKKPDPKWRTFWESYGSVEFGSG